MKNKEVAQIFRQIAEILEIQAENPFRIRAYLRAAQTIASLSRDVRELADENKLEDLPGIGKDLAEKIKEIVATGRLKFYEQLREEIPEGLTILMSVPGLGPKTAKLLYEKLSIKNLKELEQAALNHKISSLPGFKDKTEENILKGLALTKKARQRMTLAQAITLAEEFTGALKNIKQLNRVEPAGSLRRRKETVRDIDILITSREPERIMDIFTQLPQVKRVQARGKTKSSILTNSNVQVDLRVVEPKSLGAALLYFTGSKEHNIRLRQLAIKHGFKINEYGLFKGKKRLAGETEQEIYKKLKLPFIVPELREDRGEIEAGLSARLPKVISLEMIKGDLHLHSSWSDGIAEIKQMARAAQAKGYQYIAICDHSQSIKIANGLSIERLKRQIESVHKLNSKLKGFRILAGSEVDVKSDGSLDYPDNILKQLDIVVAAVHTGFKQSEQQMTNRIISAMENRYVNILAHPSGRLLGQREPYALDMQTVLEQARQTHTFLEINAFPDRLDLIDVNCYRARELGARIVINTDAHQPDHLDFMALGVTVARRGWLEQKDVVNTLPLEQLLGLIRQKRENG